MKHPSSVDALIYDLEEAKGVFHAIRSKQVSGKSLVYDSLVQKLGLWLLKPNIRFDHERTDQRLLDARNKTDKVFIK